MRLGWGERERRPTHSNRFAVLNEDDHGGDFDISDADWADRDGGLGPLAWPRPSFRPSRWRGRGGRTHFRWSGGASGFNRRGGAPAFRRGGASAYQRRSSFSTPAFRFGDARDDFHGNVDYFHRDGQCPALGATQRFIDGGRHGGTGWDEHGLGSSRPRRPFSTSNGVRWRGNGFAVRWRGNGFADHGLWRPVGNRGRELAFHGSDATVLVSVPADDKKGSSDLDSGSRDSIFCTIKNIESKIFRFECFAPSLIRITELKNDVFCSITFDLDGANWLKDSLYDIRLKNWKITRFEDSRTIHLSFDFNSASEFFHLWVDGGQGIYIPAGSQNKESSLFISGLAQAIAYLKEIEKGIVESNALSFEAGPSGVGDSLIWKDDLIMTVQDFSYDDLGFSISKDLFLADIAIMSSKIWAEGNREVHKTDNLDLQATISDLKISIQETVSKGGEFLSANLLRDFEKLLTECAGFKNKPWLESNFTNFAHGGFGESEGNADSDDRPHSDTECDYNLDFVHYHELQRDFQGHVSGDENLTPFSSLSELRDKDANRALCSKASQVTNDTTPFTTNRNSFMGANKKKGYHVKTRSQSRF